MNNDINFMRKELDRLQTKVSNFDVITEYAYSDSDTQAPSDDTSWTTEKLSPVSGKFIWARTTMNIGYGDIKTEPYCIGDGLEHITNIDVEYTAWNDPYSPPSQDSPYWQTTAPSIQKGQYIWSRNVITTTKETHYSSPVRITGLQGADGEKGDKGIDGKSGKDGKGIEFIFKRVSTKIDDWSNPPSGVINPATLNKVTTDDYVPQGWTDDQEEVTGSLPFQYVSTRTKSVGTDGVTGEWSKFNTPRLWSVYGEKPYCHIRYADVNNPLQWSQTYPNPQTSSNGEITYHKYEGYLWNNDETLQDVDKDPTKFSWRIYRPTIGIAGEEGSFLHIQFADDEAGTNMNQYDGAFMGTCVTYEEVDPDDPDLYNWVRIRGTEGTGTEFVYYTTDDDNYSSLPSNIQNTPALKKWCERPYAISKDYPYCYISVREYVEESWSSWSSPVLWAKYGSDGQKGDAGENGADGEGLELIFCRNNSTSTAPTFVNGQNRATFDGQVDNKSYQDTDFVPQGWSDNQQGVNSSNTVEWVCMRFKRPNSNGDGIWGDFNTPKVWATYSKDGRSVLSIEEQYGVSTSLSTVPSDWVTSITSLLVNGEFEKGKWYWTRSKITYSDVGESGSNIEYVGLQVINMVDSDTEHYIFYRTATNEKPTRPTSSTEIITNNDQEGKDINTNAWFENILAPTPQLKYLWCSQQTYDGMSKTWSNYCEPYLVDTYVFYGSDGGEGETGIHGVDGTALTGDEIEDKTTDTTTKVMNDSVPSNFVSETGNFYKKQIGQYTTNINRQGNLVLINLRATLQDNNTKSSTTDGYFDLMELPSWAIPYEDTFFSDAVHLVDQSLRYRIRPNSDGTAMLGYWKESTDPTFFNMTGTTMYFANDLVREKPTISLQSNYSMAVGNSMVVRLSNNQDKSIKNAVLYFKVNGVIYQRTTDSNGTARLSINIPSQQRVTVWYDGYDYKETGEIIGLNEKYTKTSETFVLFMKPTQIRQINYLTDDKGHFVEFITNTGNPYKYSDVDLNIDRKGYWTTQTDGKGRVYFDLMGYDKDKGVEVSVKVRKSSKIMYDVENTQVLKNNGSTFTISSFPTSIEHNISWENASIENITSINDSKYMKSALLNPNDYGDTGQIWIYFRNMNIPLNATVTSLKVIGNFTTLEGNTQLERPIFEVPTIIGETTGVETITFTPTPNTMFDYDDCGVWRRVEYSCDKNTLDAFNETHSARTWENFKLLFSTDVVRSSTRKDKGRFAVDYLKLELEYTIDNSKSLIPSSGLISFDASDRVGDEGYYQGVANKYIFTVLEDNEPLANTDVKITFYNQTYTRKSNENGVVSFTLPNVGSGNFIIRLSVGDFETYQFVEIKPPIWVDSEEIEIYQGGTATLIINGVNTEGEKLNGGTVTISIDGRNDITSFTNGVATYDYSSTDVGEHMAVIHVVTTEYSTDLYAKITVLPCLIGADLTKYYHCNKPYEVLLVDGNGNGVNGETITFNINGIDYPRTTGAYDGVDGVARINVNIEAGNYPITATWENITITNTLNILPVLRANDLTMHYGDGSKFMAILVDCDGNPYPNQEITFNINGVFYKRTTDSKGIAKLNITLQGGEYIITSTYETANIANTVKVI